MRFRHLAFVRFDETSHGEAVHFIWITSFGRIYLTILRPVAGCHTEQNVARFCIIADSLSLIVCVRVYAIMHLLLTDRT